LPTFSINCCGFFSIIWSKFDRVCRGLYLSDPMLDSGTVDLLQLRTSGIGIAEPAEQRSLPRTGDCHLHAEGATAQAGR
jgi:hypothetical protein